MLKVFKYPVGIGRFALSLPRGAQILTVQTQEDRPSIWVLVNPDSDDIVTREFVLVGTGYELPTGGLAYIGTFQVAGGAFVWHLFEVGR